MVPTHTAIRLAAPIRPGAIFLQALGGIGQPADPMHPLTFKPEFIDAFELGSKNTLLDGALTFNGDLFYYNYENYQISEIVDRTAINQNFDAHVKGAEVESTYEPIPGLRFNFAGGWEDTALAKGTQAVDLMDRTAGQRAGSWSSGLRRRRRTAFFPNMSSRPQWLTNQVIT